MNMNDLFSIAEEFFNQINPNFCEDYDSYLLIFPNNFFHFHIIISVLRKIRMSFSLGFVTIIQ